MSQLDDLKAQVEQTVGAEASAVALIKGLAQKLQDALDNNANSATQVTAIAEVIAELHASGDALAAAVTSNTPQQPAQQPPAPPAAAPAPVPAPPPAPPAAVPAPAGTDQPAAKDAGTPPAARRVP